MYTRSASSSHEAARAFSEVSRFNGKEPGFLGRRSRLRLVRDLYFETLERGFQSLLARARRSCERAGGEQHLKTYLEKLLRGKGRISRPDIHVPRVVCYCFPAVFRISAALSPFFPSLKKMCVVRSSVSALIACQPAFIARAVTFSNLTRAREIFFFLPCVRRVPYGHYSTTGTACRFCQTSTRRIPDSTFVTFSPRSESSTAGIVVSLQSRCVRGPSASLGAAARPCEQRDRKAVHLRDKIETSGDYTPAGRLRYISNIEFLHNEGCATSAGFPRRTNG